MAQESINEEIKWLEEQLGKKRREMAERGEVKEEKEMVKESLKELAEAGTEAPKPPSTSSGQATPPPAIADDEAKQHAYELQEKEHEETIDELVSIAFSKGLMSAIKVAESLKNPHLLDDFHDTLADKYYEKLQESRKIAN
jgi:replicative superfamily II helicase